MDEDGAAEATEPLRATPLRFRNGRYEGRGMPLAAIDDLREYQLLLQEAARAIWLERHPGSKKVPQKVIESVSLRLVAFEPGSVIPVLEREATLDLSTDFDLFLAAEARVDEAFAAIVEGRDADAVALGIDGRRLHAFGKRLTTTERVEFKRTEQQSVTYSKELRKASIKRAEKPDTQNEPKTLTYVGLLRGIETKENGGTFKLRRFGGGELGGSFDDPESFKDLKEALDLVDGSSFVRLTVRARVSDASTTIESVTQVEQFDVEDSPWRHRLRELLAYEPSDDDEIDHDPVRIEDLQQIDRLLSALPGDLATTAALGSAPGGHTFAEWTAANRLVRVQIDEDLDFKAYQKILGARPAARLHFDHVEDVSAWVQEAVAES